MKSQSSEGNRKIPLFNTGDDFSPEYGNITLIKSSRKSPILHMNFDKEDFYLEKFSKENKQAQ